MVLTSWFFDVTRHLYKWYLSLGLLACLVYLVLPKSTPKEFLYVVISLSTLFAAIFGYAKDRPKPARSWIQFIVGIGIISLTEAAYFFLITIGDRPEVESRLNMLYLLGYVFELIGLMGLVRARTTGSSRSNWLDAAVVGLGAGAVTWSTLYDAVIDQEPVTRLELMYQLGAPMLGVGLIMLSARLVIGERTLRTGFGLLLLGCALQTGTDVTTNALDTYIAGGAGDAVWAAAYVLIGAALLHPSRLVVPRQSLTAKARDEANQALAIQGLVILAVLGAIDLRIASLVPWPTMLAWNVSGLVILIINRARKFSLVRMVGDASASDNQRQLTAMIENSHELVGLINADGTVRYASPSFGAVTGIPSEKWTNRSFEDIVAPLAPSAQGLFAQARRMGNGGMVDWEGDLFPLGSKLEKTVKMSIVNHIDTVEINGFVISARDVTDEATFTSRLRHQALHDTLTGLPNRALLFDRIEHALELLNRTPATVTAVAIVDLDDFKAVNDTLGHDKGDELLKGIARRLTDALRSGDTVARLGGDEFALLLENTTIEEAMSTAQRVATSLALPLVVSGAELAVSASIGVVCNYGPGDPLDLLRSADIAMYEAKREGKSRVKLFEEQMRQSPREQLSMRVDLGAALTLNQLSLNYQPIVDTANRDIVGVEALLRWNHPTRGSVSPADFIPAAEQTGLISAIGEWVLRAACFEAASWKVFGATPYISVNVSAAQITDRQFVRTVTEILNASQLPAEQLLLEITETMLLGNNASVQKTVDDLRSLGIRIAIDDFGTGYSSLAYLRQLAIDVVKIDQSFVRDIDSDSDHKALTQTMLALADGLAMTSVAEGVETEAELGELVALGCRYAQGFLFSHPIPAEALVTLMQVSSG
jgi:diguanylate cyclase (GGDEF)-like protein/PAS domain S-box-containing protein